MGRWGCTSTNVTHSGRVLPCRSAETITGLTFENVREKSLRVVWLNSPSFNAYCGTSWMREPCRSCEFQEVAWGGCRSQARLLADKRRD